MLGSHSCLPCCRPCGQSLDSPLQKPRACAPGNPLQHSPSLLRSNRTRNSVCSRPRVSASGPETPGKTSKDGSSSSQELSEQSSQAQTSMMSRPGGQPPSPRPNQDESNLLAGVLEEVNLIEWPKFTQALRDTFVVIGIVGALSVLLFITNGTFIELSRLVYKS